MSYIPSLVARLRIVSQDDARLDSVRDARRHLSEDEQTQLDFSWPLTARQNQRLPDGLWTAWILMAGRGFGKTRTGAEWVRAQVESGKAGRIALVARTPAEIRDTMIQGPSGLLSICPPWAMPEYESTKKKLTWPNGATAFLFSSYEPDQLRGQQFDAAWCDELASWKYPRDTWDNLAFALRLGLDPRCVVTTTPKPIALLRELVVTARRYSHTRHHLRQRGQPRSQLLLPHQVPVRGHTHRTTGDPRRPSRPVRRRPLGQTVDRRLQGQARPRQPCRSRGRHRPRSLIQPPQ